MSTILDRTQAFLLAQPEVSAQAIRTIYLNNYFTVVELEDANVGACMSSYSLPPEATTRRQQEIRALLAQDPLLLRYCQTSDPEDLVASSLRAAVINALSAPFLRAGNDPGFVIREEFPHHYFANVQYAVVIGYGGLLEFLVQRTTIPRIHVSDLLYQKRRSKLDARTQRLSALRPGLQLTVSDGSDTAAHLQKADLVSITGSTLTNNTLEGLLQAASNCPKIILQGQSACIHPRELFAAGIDLLITTLKTRDVAKAAFWDPTGNALRPLMEGGLPWMHIWPKTP